MVEDLWMTQTNKLLVIIALFWFAQYIYVPNTAPYLLSQKVTADFVGLIVGLYGGVQMTLRFPLGISADLLGRHKLIIIIGCCFSGGASIIRLLESNGMDFLCLCSALSGGAAVLLALTLKENDPQYAHLMPEESNHQRPALI